MTEWAGIDTGVPLVPQLADRVRLAAPEGAETVLVGSTGLGPDDSAAALNALLPGTREVLLAHDSVTCYLGALGDRTGCVVAAGTGVVTLAAGRTRVKRVDGWGWIIGDAGSGSWIGKRAFDAVMRAYDGRGPATLLTDVIAADFPDLESAYLELQADPRRVFRLASYARRVDDVAAQDEVARRILQDAAAEMVTSAVRGLEQVDADAGDPVCQLGNVFRSAVVREAFVAGLSEQRPSARLEAPSGTSLDGADLLDRVSTGLTTRVDRSVG